MAHKRLTNEELSELHQQRIARLAGVYSMSRFSTREAFSRWQAAKLAAQAINNYMLMLDDDEQAAGDDITEEDHAINAICRTLRNASYELSIQADIYEHMFNRLREE